MLKIHQQNTYSILNLIIHKEIHLCEKIRFPKNRSFCQSYPQIFTLMELWWQLARRVFKDFIECTAYYHYSLILWYFLAKPNIFFFFQIKSLATTEHMRDRKNARQYQCTVKHRYWYTHYIHITNYFSDNFRLFSIFA